MKRSIAIVLSAAAITLAAPAAADAAPSTGSAAGPAEQTFIDLFLAFPMILVKCGLQAISSSACGLEDPPVAIFGQ